jgi:hypothetical protein
MNEKEKRLLQRLWKEDIDEREWSDSIKIILIIIGFAVLMFFAGYTMGEEKTEARMVRQQRDMGIVHMERQPYRCERITGKEVKR